MNMRLPADTAEAAADRQQQVLDFLDGSSFGPAKGDASDATRNVALKQETFAIGAVNWHMIDASGTPDQSLRSARASLLAVPGER